MKRLLIATALSLVSISSSAATLSVLVFKTDDAPVVMSNRVPAGMEVTIYNVDAMKKVDGVLAQRLEEEIKKPEYRKHQAGKNRYMAAFSHLINSSDWSEYADHYQESLEPIDQALRHGIKKLPAYVFDHKYIVYGVPSFREALSIYQRKVQ